MASLARPLDLFILPAAAGCSVVQASASLESEAEHDAHGHEEHAEEEGHAHEEHAEEEGHAHEEHAEEEGHDHEEHAAHEGEHGHEEHGHDEHAEEAGHTEFHAEYMLNCAEPTEANLITFAYFDTFPNALELEIQVISEQGATAFEVERDVPTLDLRDMF